MRYGQFFLAKEGGKFCIRRIVYDDAGVKRQPRYPAVKYAHLKTESELNQLVVRLNHEAVRTAKERIEVRTSFISPRLMDEFHSYLQVSVPNEKDFKYLYYTVLQRYFLHFFITNLGLLDPRTWHKNQSAWGSALLSKSRYQIFDRPVSAKTIKTTVQLANRFMKFLHLQNPIEYPSVTLEPVSRAAVKEYEASRKLDVEEAPGTFVTAEQWAAIEPILPVNIASQIKLMYYYGLRRSESLGFEDVSAVRHAGLMVRKQAKAKGKRTTLKGRGPRLTPHWFLSPAECYKLIAESLVHRMHPDTLAQRFEELNLPFQLHDLRRTFITRALRGRDPRDVQLAVGHEDLRTTMAYAQDDRALNEAVWTPG